MARTVKQKIRLGTTFLLLLLFLLGSVGIYHIVRLKEDSQLILTNNYESIDYCHTMQRSIDSFNIAESFYVAKFDSALRLQEKNVTEAGESDFTGTVRSNFIKYKEGDHSDSVRKQLQAAIQRILQLNMNAIETKNKKASATADDALTYISIIAGITLLVSLSFSFSFPGIVTDPIDALTGAIEQVTAKNYSY